MNTDKDNSHMQDVLLLAMVIGLALFCVDIILINLAAQAFGHTLSFFQTVVVTGLYRGLKPSRAHHSLSLARREASDNE